MVSHRSYALNFNIQLSYLSISDKLMKKKDGTESVLRAVTVSKHDSYCQPTVIVISRDRPAHTFHKGTGDR